MDEGSGGDVLTPDDAVDVWEELLPAQNVAYKLGMKLKLTIVEVQSIEQTYADPEQRLLQIIIKFLNQEQNPTWKTITDALESRLVNLPQLASQIKAAHPPRPTSVHAPVTIDAPPSLYHGRSPVPPHSPRHSPQPTKPSSHSGELLVREKYTPPFQVFSPVPSPIDIRYVKSKIEKLQKRFGDIEKGTLMSFHERKIYVKHIVNTIAFMQADDTIRNKMFLQENLADLYQSKDEEELFVKLGLLHWDYLCYHQLDYLMNDFQVKHKDEMESYKLDLHRFLRKVPLDQFCECHMRRRKPSVEFQEVVAEFNWPRQITLQIVGKFQKEYSNHYSLLEYTMMLAEVCCDPVKVAWFVPGSIVEKLKDNIPLHLVKEFSLSTLTIAGVMVIPPMDSRPEWADVKTPSVDGVDIAQISADEDYAFVERPSEDFFCPVTMGLLVQPHLTSCCGKHLSEESAIRIQGEGKPCPLCKSSEWATMLNKNFKREVFELGVYCRHKEEGCPWKGKLSELQSHLHSCEFRIIEVVAKDGSCPLHSACQHGDINTVNALVNSKRYGVNEPLTEAPRNVPLGIAAQNGHVKIVQKLLEAKANINYQNKNGQTPVYLACIMKKTDVVELLVKGGANLKISDKDGRSPLCVASQEGYIDIVKILVKGGADLEQLTKTGRPPVYYASRSGHANIVQFLIESGAQFNFCTEKSASPLQIASQEGHSDVVDILIKAGADVHLATVKNGSFPLEIAAENGHTESVELMLKAGASVNSRNKLGRTALSLASFKGNKAVVDLLLKFGADVQISDKEGFTALFTASMEGHTEVVDLLIKAGADIHQATTKMGRDPLQAAVMNGHADTVLTLLNAGASVDHEDALNDTALSMARAKKHHDLEKLLLEHQEQK